MALNSTPIHIPIPAKSTFSSHPKKPRFLRASPLCLTRSRNSVPTRFTVTSFRDTAAGFSPVPPSSGGGFAVSDGGSGDGGGGGGGLRFPEMGRGNSRSPANTGGGFAGSGCFTSRIPASSGGGGFGFRGTGHGYCPIPAISGGGVAVSGGGSGGGDGGGGSGFPKMGRGYICTPASSGGGFDGTGGSGSGDGSGGGGGGGGCSGDNSTWKLLLWYMVLLESYPDLTRSVTSASLMLFGDWIFQLPVDEGSSLYYRGIMFALSGLVLFGPALHFWCRKLLAKFLVLTKAVTSALLKLVGDFIFQVAIHKVLSLDYKMTLMLTFLGLVLVGPTLHFWYLYLSKSVTLPGASGALLCHILDKIPLGPAFFGLRLSASATLVRRLSEVVLELPQEWFSSVLANWQLWRLFQFLDFCFVPPKSQLPLNQPQMLSAVQ